MSTIFRAPRLRLTVLRDGREVAFAVLPIEELDDGGMAGDADRIAGRYPERNDPP